MNVDVAIAIINPVFKEWESMSSDVKTAKNSRNNYLKKIRNGVGKEDSDITQKIPFLLAEQIQSANSGVGDPELQNKYNELVKAKTLLENDLIDLRNEMKQKDADIQDYEYRCNIKVKNANRKIEILETKIKSVKKWWKNDLGGDIDDLLGAMNKKMIHDIEFDSDEDDPKYTPYSDEDK